MGNIHDRVHQSIQGDRLGPSDPLPPSKNFIGVVNQLVAMYFQYSGAQVTCISAPHTPTATKRPPQFVELE